MARKTPSVLTALHDSLRSAPVSARGTALAALAKAYAAHIDSAADPEVRAKALSDLGPKFLAALQALGLTTELRDTGTSPTGMPATTGQGGGFVPGTAAAAHTAPGDDPDRRACRSLQSAGQSTPHQCGNPVA